MLRLCDKRWVVLPIGRSGNSITALPDSSLTLLSESRALFASTFPMKFESFKYQLATDVAAKSGITSDQAASLITHIASHAEENLDATINLEEFGEIHLLKIPSRTSPETLLIKGPSPFASQTIARFKVKDAWKEIQFTGLEQAWSKEIRWYKVIGGGYNIQVLCGLEGDPHTDPPDIIIRTEDELGVL